MSSPLRQPNVPPHAEHVRQIPISLIRGGTFYRVQERARLIRPHTWDLHRRLPLAIAVAWIPVLILAATFGGIQALQAVLVDYRVYARAFIAIPLLLIGQITMEVYFREMAQHFLDANIIRIEDLSRFRQIMQKTRRLRDAWLPELVVVVAAYAQVAYLHQSDRLRFASWAAEAAGSNTLTPAGYYSLFVTNALFLVLAAIVLWKWVIWVYVLRQISRLDLQLDATNGDLTGGLGFLGEVPMAFVPAVLAVSAVLGGNWRYQVLTGQTMLEALWWPTAVCAVLILLVLLLPLSLFSPSLMREKRLSTRRYGSMQHLVSLQFRHKWTRRHNEHVEELLAGPDVSSLADLSGSFKNVEQMLTYPFRKSTVIALLVALALPLIPVITTRIPLKEVIQELFAAIH
jgi:hypothetical protein